MASLLTGSLEGQPPDEPHPAPVTEKPKERAVTGSELVAPIRGAPSLSVKADDTKQVEVKVSRHEGEVCFKISGATSFIINNLVCE